MTHTIRLAPTLPTSATTTPGDEKIPDPTWVPTIKPMPAPSVRAERVLSHDLTLEQPHLFLLPLSVPRTTHTVILPAWRQRQ